MTDITLSTFTDQAAEENVVASLLFDPETFPAVRSIVTPDYFYSAKLGSIFRAFSEEYEKRGLLDLATLAKVAGVPLQDVAHCMTVDVIPSLAPVHARKVAELSYKRHVAKQTMQTLAELETLTPAEIAKKFSDIAAEITISNHSKAVFDAKALCNRVLNLQQARMDNRVEVRGLNIGFPFLGRLLKGMQPKRVTVIAAATGFGKSTLALNLLHNVTVADHRALFISNENDVDLNLDRLCGIFSGLKLKDIESGNHHDIAIDFGSRFFNSGLFMTDNSPRTIEEIIGTISRHAIQHKIQIAFIDYIGEITHSGDTRETEEARLARYAQKIVDCAKSLEIHIVLMAQLNRQGNTKGRPSKAELAGCFRIAQKAHSLLLFWQDDQGRDILTIDKNRQGPAGIDIRMQFDRTTQRITEDRILTAD